jgi:hypothetical protein
MTPVRVMMKTSITAIEPVSSRFRCVTPHRLSDCVTSDVVGICVLRCICRVVRSIERDANKNVGGLPLALFCLGLGLEQVTCCGAESASNLAACRPSDIISECLTCHRQQRFRRAFQRTTERLAS